MKLFISTKHTSLSRQTLLRQQKNSLWQKKSLAPVRETAYTAGSPVSGESVGAVVALYLVGESPFGPDVGNEVVLF